MMAKVRSDTKRIQRAGAGPTGHHTTNTANATSIQTRRRDGKSKCDSPERRLRGSSFAPCHTSSQAGLLLFESKHLCSARASSARWRACMRVEGVCVRPWVGGKHNFEGLFPHLQT